jgi:hypothetical protein
MAVPGKASTLRAFDVILRIAVAIDFALNNQQIYGKLAPVGTIGK